MGIESFLYFILPLMIILAVIGKLRALCEVEVFSVFKNLLMIFKFYRLFLLQTNPSASREEQKNGREKKIKKTEKGIKFAGKEKEVDWSN